MCDLTTMKGTKILTEIKHCRDSVPASQAEKGGEVKINFEDHSPDDDGGATYNVFSNDD